MANAAKVMGIIGTVLLVVGVGIFLLVFIAASSGEVVTDRFEDMG